MYYRVFDVDKALEQEMLAARDGRQAVSALVGALSRQGFRIAEEDAESLAESILEKLRDASGACRLLKGFDVRTKEDGAAWLARYQFEYLAATFKMDDAGDRNLTGQKIISVDIFTRRESREANVVIPQGVSALDQYCFRGCAGIMRIAIPEGVERIAQLACASCKDLEEVVLPDSVTAIEACAFACCPNLKTVRLPSQLASIGPLAFCGCESLERLALPDTVVELGYGAFANCTSLVDLQAPARLAIPAEKHVFYGCDGLDVSGVPLGQLAAPGKAVLDELQCAVDFYAYLHLNDANWQFIFAIQEIDAPDASHLGAKVSDDGLARDICSYFECGDLNMFYASAGVKATQRQAGTEFMQAVVVDTFRSIGIEVFGDTEEGLAYYEEEYHCIDLVSLRFLCIEGQWYTMTFEWSD